MILCLLTIKRNIAPLIFVLAVILWSTDLSAQSQDKKIVRLKTSEKLTGTIIEAVPDQYIKLQMEDNTVRTINADDISEIRDDDKTRAANRRKARADAPIGLSMIGSIFAGADVVSGLSYLLVQPCIIPGVRIKAHHLGLGLGLIYGRTLDPANPNFGPYNNTNTSPTARPELFYFPIYLNYHGDYGKRKVYFSADASIGYPANISKGNVYEQYYDPTLSINHNETIKQTGQMYAELAPGVSFRLSQGLLLNVSATFHLLMIKEINQDVQQDVGYTAYYNPTINSNQRLLGTMGAAIKIIY